MLKRKVVLILGALIMLTVVSVSLYAYQHVEAKRVTSVDIFQVSVMLNEIEKSPSVTDDNPYVTDIIQKYINVGEAVDPVLSALRNEDFTIIEVNDKALLKREDLDQGFLVDKTLSSNKSIKLRMVLDIKKGKIVKITGRLVRMGL